MSGIAGVMTAGEEAVSPAFAASLAAALSHRGPDGEGRFVTNRITLIHLRLGGEEQPFYAQEGAVLIADGSPRSEGAAGEARSVRGLLDYYRGDGLRFAESLSGDYALALYDPAERTLTLARDAIGQRPLYYAETDDGLVFASEPRALFAAGRLSARLRPAAVSELLQLQFTTGRRTLYENVMRLLPGEAVIARRGRIVERRRRVLIAGLPPARLSEAEALERLPVLLKDALTRALGNAGDAALAIRPSAGSAALALAAREAGTNFAALVAASRAQGEDESRLSAYAALLGRAPAPIVVADDGIVRALPQIIAALDDPVADYAAIPGYFAAQRAAQDANVLLSDEGADEVFAGYSRYRAATRPFWLGGRALRTRGFFDGLHLLRDETPRWRDGVVAAERRIAEEPFSELQAAQALDGADYLPHDVLNRLDRTTAIHGIESRAPFLDPALAVFGFRLPDGLKISAGKGAWLLRRWLEAHAPAAPALLAREKRSWLSPWLEKLAPELALRLPRHEAVAAACRPEQVAWLYRALARRPGKRLLNAGWQLLFFALWHSIHIEGRDPMGGVLDVLK